MTYVNQLGLLVTFKLYNRKGHIPRCVISRRGQKHKLRHVVTKHTSIEQLWPLVTFLAVRQKGEKSPDVCHRDVDIEK